MLVVHGPQAAGTGPGDAAQRAGKRQLKRTVIPPWQRPDLMSPGHFCVGAVGGTESTSEGGREGESERERERDESNRERTCVQFGDVTVADGAHLEGRHAVAEPGQK